LEVASGDVELANFLGDDWLLPLDFVVKLDVGLSGALDWLGAVFLAHGFDLCNQLLAFVVADESENELRAHKHDALALLLELLGELGQEREVKSRRLLVRLHEEQLSGLVGVNYILDLEVEDLEVLLLGEGGQLLVLVEKPVCSGQDLSLVHAPGRAELVHDVLLFVQLLNCFLEGHVVKTHDSV